jgi:hypothetical protein
MGKKAYRKQEPKDKRYNSARPKEVEEKCKWRLYHNDEMISGSMNKRIKRNSRTAPHKDVIFQTKAHATSSCRLGESNGVGPVPEG